MIRAKWGRNGLLPDHNFNRPQEPRRPPPSRSLSEWPLFLALFLSSLTFLLLFMYEGLWPHRPGAARPRPPDLHANAAQLTHLATLLPRTFGTGVHQRPSQLEVRLRAPPHPRLGPDEGPDQPRPCRRQAPQPSPDEKSRTQRNPARHQLIPADTLVRHPRDPAQGGFRSR